jgi:hypothetical protein
MTTECVSPFSIQQCPIWAIPHPASRNANIVFITLVTWCQIVETDRQSHIRTRTFKTDVLFIVLAFNERYDIGLMFHQIILFIFKVYNISYVR